MRNLSPIAVALWLGATAPAAYSEECRTAGNIRIDSAAELYKLDGICKVAGNLAIFPDDVESLVLPDLKEARLINIDSNSLKAVAMPKLERVTWLYLQSPSLEAIELTRLKNVGETFGVSEGNALRYLSVPALNSVGKLYMQDNTALEFVFAEQISVIGTLVSDNNPALADESFKYLQAASLQMSPSLRQQRADVAHGLGAYRQQVVTSYLNPNLPSTGHPTYFGTIGFAPPYVRRYYDVYPYHYDGLWAYYLARARYYDWLGGYWIY